MDGIPRMGQDLTIKGIECNPAQKEQCLELYRKAYIRWARYQNLIGIRVFNFVELKIKKLDPKKVQYMIDYEEQEDAYLREALINIGEKVFGKRPKRVSEHPGLFAPMPDGSYVSNPIIEY